MKSPLFLLPFLLQSSLAIDGTERIISQFQAAIKLKELPREERATVSLDEILRSLIDPSLQDGIRSHSNSDCQRDLLRFAEALRRPILNSSESIPSEDSRNRFRDEVVVQALDASGKPGTAIQRGHVVWMGLLSLCRDINFIEDNGDSFTTEYFRVFVDPRPSPSFPCLPLLHIDACLPSSCSSLQLVDVFAGQGNFSVCDVAAINDNVPPVVTGTYVVGAVMASFLFLSISSGIADGILGVSTMDRYSEQNSAFRFFTAFSLYRNLADLFTVSREGKEGQIGPLHCIRFFSMCWIIAGHFFYFQMPFTVNPLDIYDEFPSWIGVLFTNAFLAVDSFFFLSGLLLSFLFFKQVNKFSSAATSLSSWGEKYLHRILRLSPPYYFLIIGYTFLFSTWFFDMPQFIGAQKTGEVWDPCRRTWWVNLLYVQNFVEYKNQCYVPSWYLATELQLFLFSPLVLVPLALSPVGGVAVALSICVASVAANAWVVFVNFFPPTGVPFGVHDERMTRDQTDYNFLIYQAHWIRCPIYIIGMLVGWFLQRTPKLRINRILNVVLWLLSIALLLTLVLCLHDWNNRNVMGRGWSAAYNSLSKPAWGLGLAWITVSCYYGYGGVVDSFMSSPVFVPFGRVSYCAYLVHMVVMSFYVGMSNGPMTFTTVFSSITFDAVPVIIFTFFISFLWSAVFEIPFGKVEVMLFDRNRGLKRIAKKCRKVDSLEGRTLKNANGWKELNEYPEKYIISIEIGPIPYQAAKF